MSKDSAKQGDAPVHPEAAAKPDADGLATPEEHAAATGNVSTVKPFVSRLNGKSTARKAFSWQHNAAAALHGWAAHAHHEGQPIRLSREAYLAALKAAEAPVPISASSKVTDYVPHAAALSKHCPHAKADRK